MNFIVRWIKSIFAFKRLNTDLATQLEFFKASFALSSDMRLVIDNATKRIIKCNQSVLDFFSLPEHVLLDSNPETLLKLEINGSDSFYTTSQVHDRFLSIKFNRLYVNGRKTIFLSVRDITEVIDTQKTNIIQERKFYDLFNISNDPIFLVDIINGHIINANYSAIERFAFNSSDVEGLSVSKLFHDQSIFDTEIKQIKKVNLSSVLMRTRYDSVFPAELSLHYYTEDNRILAFLVVHDISRHVQIEEELKYNYQRAQALLHISEELYTTKKFEDFHKVFDNLLDFRLGAEWGYKIGVYDKRTGLYTIVCQTDPAPKDKVLFDKLGGMPTNNPVHLYEVKYFSGLAIQNKKTIIVQNNHSDFALQVCPHEIEGSPHSMIFIPLFHLNEFIGIFSLGRSPVNSMPADFVEFLESVAKYVSLKVWELLQL